MVRRKASILVSCQEQWHPLQACHPFVAEPEVLTAPEAAPVWEGQRGWTLPWAGGGGKLSTYSRLRCCRDLFSR